MTTLGIRYLTGHAVATNVAREGAEWPPQPGRVFMAMAAAYFETGGDPQEKGALEWLEAQEMPSIRASECSARTENGSDLRMVGVYVPVNDEASIPRRKQERVFPTVRPEHDTVFLNWKADAPEEVRAALAALCAKVTRIGHSSSLAQMWMEDCDAIQEEFGTELWPEGSGWVLLAGDRMRVAGRGSLAYLKSEFNSEARAQYAVMVETLEVAKGKEKTQLKKLVAETFPNGEPVVRRPKMANWVGYGKRDKEAERKSAEDIAIKRGLFEARNVVVLGRVQGERLGLESTLQLTGALRAAAMKAAGNAVPEWLSGHMEDGAPTKKPHAAFFPLPYVDAEHADGHVLGLAIAIPRGVESEKSFREVMGTLLFDEDGGDRLIHLWKDPGRGGSGPKIWDWYLKRSKSAGYEPRATLQIRQWTEASCVWASVTPVVLHHYPKKNRVGDVAEIVGEAFVSAGLPKPMAISVQPVSYFRGAGHARNIPEFHEGGERFCRYQTHVAVEFANPVEGPVLVGRGRFRGYGLCRPVEGEGSSGDERTDGE